MRLLVAFLLLLLTVAPGGASMFLYIGTQSADPGTGLSLAEFDAESGTLTSPKLVHESSRPALFVIPADGRHLYTINTGDPGGVSAFAIDRQTGALTLLNQVMSPARGPSYLSLDQTEHYLLGANFGGGYVEVITVASDGSLGRQTALMQHYGRSVDPDRQTAPHAHAVRIDLSNRFAVATDLGLDRVFVYRFDATDGTLTPNNPPYVSVSPGSGPRHMAWHPDGRFLCVVEEMENEVTTFRWNPDEGKLTALETVSTLPVDYAGDSAAAEVAVHANGRFVYASNRGHDSIAVFAIDENTGTLTPIEHVDARGKIPRYFVFDPTNQWMLVANQDSDNIAVFRVDAVTGRLTPYGDTISTFRPGGMAFLP